MTVKSTRRTSKRASTGDRQKTVDERTSSRVNVLYQELFASSPDGILLIDAETQRVVEFNDAACRQLGHLDGRVVFHAIFRNSDACPVARR